MTHVLEHTEMCDLNALQPTLPAHHASQQQGTIKGFLGTRIRAKILVFTSPGFERESIRDPHHYAKSNLPHRSSLDSIFGSRYFDHLDVSIIEAGLHCEQ